MKKKFVEAIEGSIGHEHHYYPSYEAYGLLHDSGAFRYAAMYPDGEVALTVNETQASEHEGEM